MEYDDDGHLTKYTDPVNNLSYTSSYDSTDRLIGTTVTDTTTNSRKAAFEYDFDNSNHISNLTTTTPSGTTSIEYEYRKENLPIRSEIADGKILTLSYDGLGRVKATKLNTSTAVWNYYTYHGFSENNKSYTSTLLRTEQNKDFGFKYNYDKNGNMTKLFVGTNTGGTDYIYSATETERYYYDALGQLTRVDYNDRNRRVVYTYDNAGNIQTEKVYDTTDPETLLTTNTYTYGDSSWGDLLTEYNNNTFTYDAIGNPLNYRDGITFSWSNGRQLQSYSKDNTTVTYTYDNSGLRLSKNVNGTQYSYLYHGGNLMQETVGTKILDYFYDASGNPLAVKYRTSENSSPEWYYYALNSRGDVIGLYTPSGNLYCTYTYDVWGNILSVKNANGVEVTYLGSIVHLQSLKYRGYVYDLETGHYYLQGRYYDPVTHRFINSDGLVSTGQGLVGNNMFIYCENDPINNEDTCGNRYCAATSVQKESFPDRSASCQEQNKVVKSKNNPAPIGNYSKGDVYLVSDSSTMPTTWEGDIIIIDRRNIPLKEDPSIRIMYSYQITDETLQREILSIISNYDNNNPSNWNRGNDIDNMIVEWDAHNSIYNITHITGPSSTLKRAMHVDIDNKDKGKSKLDHTIGRLWQELFG